MFFRTIPILWISLVTIECKNLHPSSSRFEVKYHNASANPADKIFENTDLLMAFVVFRHGDRTPDFHELKLLPTPRINESMFYPFGLGALTNQGKQRAFKLGEYIKNRYSDFLSPLYLPNEITARSTDFARTKMTVLTVLAAMFPPREPEIWNTNLNWQPIPYNTLPTTEDDLNIFGSCPTFRRLEKEVTGNSPLILDYKYLFDFVREKSGYSVSKLSDIYFFGNLLRALENFDAVIPEWVQEIRSGVTELVGLQLSLEFSTDEMKSLSSGVFMGEFINASKSVLEGADNYLLHIYCGHDITLASLLSSLQVFKPHQPDFGSAIFLELRKRRHSNEYGVVVSYAGKVGDPAKILSIPGCGEKMCDFNTFEQLVSKFVLTRAEFKKKCNE